MAHRIINHEALVALLEDRLELYPVVVNLILLVVEIDDLARHQQHKSLRTLACPSGATGCVEQLMRFKLLHFVDTGVKAAVARDDHDFAGQIPALATGRCGEEHVDAIGRWEEKPSEL